MAIVIKCSGASWQGICDALLRMAPQCREVPHFLWIERPDGRVIRRELEVVLAQLGLEEQFAYLDEAGSTDLREAITVYADGERR